LNVAWFNLSSFEFPLLPTLPCSLKCRLSNKSVQSRVQLIYLIPFIHAPLNKSKARWSDRSSLLMPLRHPWSNCPSSSGCKYLQSAPSTSSHTSDMPCCSCICLSCSEIIRSSSTAKAYGIPTIKTLVMRIYTAFPPM
jgi:hypothetical protein